MDSSVDCDLVCKFVWQYESRKQWNTFTAEELRRLNDTINEGQKSLVLPSKRRKGETTLDFHKMVQIQNDSKYEQRIRCLVGYSDFNAWLWKDTNDWISYNPYTAFFLEIAFQRKEINFSFLGYTFDLDKFEQIDNKTKTSQSIKRITVDITVTKEVKEIFEASELLFKELLLKEFSSVKRSFVSAISRTSDDMINDVDDEPLSPVNQNVVLKIPKKVDTQNKDRTNIDSVDKMCPIRSDFHIYTDGESYSATLNQTNLQNNNNKFYIIQMLEHNERNQYCVWRRWGRVGQNGQTNLNKYADNLFEAKQEFEKKFHDKTKNNWSEKNRFVHVKGKYDLLQINLAPQIAPVKTNVSSKLPTEIQALMELICDVKRMEDMMKEMSYDSNKTPLGELTKQQVKNGYIALNKIVKVIQRGGSHSELLNACNDFYTKIPHNFGMKTPPIIKTQADIDAKQDMLEALSNVRLAMDVINSEENVSEHPLDKYYQKLSCSLEHVQPHTPEYIAIEKCLNDTHGPTHNTYTMKIVNIFKCKTSPKKTSSVNHSNNLILWHGSRIINWLGILKEGLRIAPPEAPTTGYMFGKGIYFADVSSKSANYCFATKKKNEGLLLMCEVSVGKQFPLREADEKMPENLPHDCNSVLGEGRITPSAFETTVLSAEAKVPVGNLIEKENYEGSLHYNEYIVYNTKQVKMKYLLWVKFNFN